MLVKNLGNLFNKFKIWLAIEIVNSCVPFMGAFKVPKNSLFS